MKKFSLIRMNSTQMAKFLLFLILLIPILALGEPAKSKEWSKESVKLLLDLSENLRFLLGHATQNIWDIEMLHFYSRETNLKLPAIDVEKFQKRINKNWEKIHELEILIYSCFDTEEAEVLSELARRLVLVGKEIVALWKQIKESRQKMVNEYNQQAQSKIVFIKPKPWNSERDYLARFGILTGPGWSPSWLTDDEYFLKLLKAGCDAFMTSAADPLWFIEKIRDYGMKYFVYYRRRPSADQGFTDQNDRIPPPRSSKFPRSRNFHNLFNPDIRNLYVKELTEIVKKTQQYKDTILGFFLVGNEVTFWNWKKYSVYDFSKYSEQMWREWLRKEHKSLKVINKLWGTKYGSWKEVNLNIIKEWIKINIFLRNSLNMRFGKTGASSVAGSGCDIFSSIKMPLPKFGLR